MTRNSKPRLPLNPSDVSEEQFARLGRKLISEIGVEVPHHVNEEGGGYVAIPGKDRVLSAPWPTETFSELAVLAHEIGHWTLHTEQLGEGRWVFRNIYSYRMEFEAERYAHATLEGLGVEVPPHEIASGKAYVREHVREYLRTSTDFPDQDVIAWAEIDVEAERQTEWAVTAHRALPRLQLPDNVADVVLGPVPRLAAPDYRPALWLQSPRGRDWFDGLGVEHTSFEGGRGRCCSFNITDLLSVVERARRSDLLIGRD